MYTSAVAARSFRQWHSHRHATQWRPGCIVLVIVCAAALFNGCQRGGQHADREGDTDDTDTNAPDAVDLLLARHDEIGGDLHDATLKALRLRRLLLDTSDTRVRGWLAPLDERIHLIVQAWCGDTITESGREVPVATTPVEDLFPFALVKSADAAFCGGLVVGGKWEVGPAWSMR